jgi:mono/diheme cytochrome c family protein
MGLVKPPRNLTDPAFQAKFTDADLRQVIRVGKGQMPAFGGMMADEDLGYVITFIRSLAPPGAAPVPVPLTEPASINQPAPGAAE